MSSPFQNEKSSIQEIASTVGYLDKCMKHSINYSINLIGRYLGSAKKVLEIGPAEGYLTNYLYLNSMTLDIVEPSQKFAEVLSTKYPNAKVNCCLIEEYSTSFKYDFILLSHVLEHVIDPVYVLKKCKELLADDGVLFSVVPNSHSIHRQAAVKMGMLKTEAELNGSDIMYGHKRVYNMSRLAADFVNSGLVIIETGGYWLKPLSNSQIEASWSDEMLDAFMQLGQEYPEISAEIFLASK